MAERNSIEYKVYGKYALFSDPMTKVGGEKFSYPVPTYQALKGITESIYWKPTFVWIIDEVRIMNPIEMFQQGIRLRHYQSDTPGLSIYTYLRNVEYQVRAHFEWNENRKDLLEDRNENKHWDIAKRMVAKGGRRDIFLGSRECQAYVESCQFGKGYGYYDNTDMDFSVMVHGFTYADEAVNEEDKGKMSVRLWVPSMKKGVIRFIRPEECTIKKVIHTADIKTFALGENVSAAEPEGNEE